MREILRGGGGGTDYEDTIKKRGDETNALTALYRKKSRLLRTVGGRKGGAKTTVEIWREHFENQMPTKVKGYLCY